MLLKVLAAVVAFVVGSAIIVYAGQIVAPHLLALPARSVVKAVESGVDVSMEHLEQAKARMESAAAYGIPARLLADAALLDLALSAHSDRPVDSRLSDIENARQALRASLRSAPLNGMAWFRLAYLEYRLNGAKPSPAMIDALRLSSRLASYDPAIMFNRLRLWLIAADDLEERDVALYRRQLYLAFEEDPGRLIGLADLHGRLFSVRTHLLETPANADILNRYMPVPVVPKVSR